jgi:hypothetical protein
VTAATPRCCRSAREAVPHRRWRLLPRCVCARARVCACVCVRARARVCVRVCPVPELAPGAAFAARRSVWLYSFVADGCEEQGYQARSRLISSLAGASRLLVSRAVSRLPGHSIPALGTSRTTTTALHRGHSLFLGRDLRGQ